MSGRLGRGHLARALLLSLRGQGLRPTLRRIRHRLFGAESRYIFVRYLEAPDAAFALPASDKGITVRALCDRDASAFLVRRYTPREARVYPTQALVAANGDELVGAIWYTEAVAPEQPWFAVVEPHLRTPAVFTANLYIRSDAKGAAWALVKLGSDFLASKGIRTIVGDVSTTNRPSILMTRLLGGRIVARVDIRYWWGCRATTVAPVDADRDTALSPRKRG